ncbi:unnamed protein product, partial [Nesidiocoris tenuis]
MEFVRNECSVPRMLQSKAIVPFSISIAAYTLPLWKPEKALQSRQIGPLFKHDVTIFLYSIKLAVSICVNAVSTSIEVFPPGRPTCTYNGGGLIVNQIVPTW